MRKKSRWQSSLQYLKNFQSNFEKAKNEGSESKSLCIYFLPLPIKIKEVAINGVQKTPYEWLSHLMEMPF